MGFGIKEPKKLLGDHVPGTAILYDNAANVANFERPVLPQTAKHAAGRNSNVVLVPQPSDSPNDPLNWPAWKKEMTFWSICLSVSMGGALGTVLSPVTAEIAKEFHVSIQRASLAAGYPLMTAACMAYVSHIWASTLGKRGIYIISTAIYLATCAWIIKVQSFDGLLAARTVQGLGSGAYESVVVSSIGDLFFVHERGKRIVVYNIVTLGVANLCPVAGGYISQKYGWRTQFTILTAFTAVALLIIIFCCPEHGNYNRAAKFETDVITRWDMTPERKDAQQEQVHEIPPENARSSTEQGNTPRKSYLQELAPISRQDCLPNILLLLIKPFACFMYPAVFWGFTVGGLWSSWTIGLSIVVAQIFGAPPKLFDPTRLGYLFTFPFAFIIIGCIVGFLLSDWFPKWAARHNNGIFEPEFRLILLVPVLFIGIPGLFGFGYYADRSSVHWAAASALQGLIGFASILAASVSYNYVLDCHRAQSVEVTVALIMLRNFFWFGSSYFLPTWLGETKTSTVFNIIGGIQLGITLASGTVYVYGKRMRELVGRYDRLKPSRLR
ncbi:MAG: hypothetical protein Q9227_006653 [Pyrenula ochraceoflavens]